MNLYLSFFVFSTRLCFLLHSSHQQFVLRFDSLLFHNRSCGTFFYLFFTYRFLSLWRVKQHLHLPLHRLYLILRHWVRPIVLVEYFWPNRENSLRYLILSYYRKDDLRDSLVRILLSCSQKLILFRILREKNILLRLMN